MKNPWIAAILMVGLLGSNGAACAAEPAGGQTLLVKANGLVCDFCARALEKKFKTREEVAGVSVNLTTKLVTISLKKDRSLDDETVRKLVIDSGYTVSSIDIERT